MHLLMMPGPRQGSGPKPQRPAARTTVSLMELPELSPRPDSGEVKQPVTMLNDRVLVHVPASEGERRSRAGILIPATASVARRLTWAEVAAVGPNVRSIRAGDRVLFNPEECFEVEVQGEDYVILRERDIPAVASERLEDGTGLYL
jgi:chaperonin GroES